MGGNTTFGIYVDRAEQWRAYDGLPPAIREVFARAPFDYAVTGTAKQVRASLQGGGVRG